MNYFDHTLTLRVAECDVCSHWRLSSIMTEMQEAASSHSNSLGVGRNDLLKVNVAWVLTRMHLQILRYPGPGETVTVRTWHRPARHRLYPRFFRITDAAGEVIAQASSVWILMDLETRQSAPSERLPVQLPDNSDAPVILPLRGGEIFLETPETVIPSRSVYTDLDPNGHVNNTKYADWLCNALGTETMRSSAPEDLIIQYHAEVLPDSPFALHLKREENRFQLTGVHDGDAAFEACGTLKAF